MSEEEYISVIGEIFDGYTEFNFKGEPVYFKHFSIRDQRYIHKFYEKYKNIAIKKGIPTEAEMSRQLEADGLWSQDDNLQIAELEQEVETLKETKRNLSLPSQKEKIQESINERSKDLFLLKIKKIEVMGKTAEDYGSSRSNEEFIRYVVYKDTELSKHAFSEEEFAEMSDGSVKKLVECNYSLSQKLNDQIIQEAVLRDFFNMYLSQTERIADFYGKPIVNLSVNQLKLALYARMFFNIFQHHDDIPDYMRKNPSDILRFSESKRSGSKTNERVRNKDNSATAVFGATKEDLSFVDPSAKKIDLSDQISKNGGTMNMEELMKLTN